LRRDIFAFATRTPSFLVGCGFGWAALFGFPAAGIIGKTGVVTLPPRAVGCVVIGPAIHLFFGMPDISICAPRLEKRGTWCRALLSLTNDRDGGPNNHRHRTRTAPRR
jgi:hypothetical protein